MKEIIKNTITRAFTVLLTALLCFLSFNLFCLEKIINRDVSYLQWVGITVIAFLLLTPHKIDNESKRHKVS